MELTIEVPTDDYRLAQRITFGAETTDSLEFKVKGTSAVIGLAKLPPEWDKTSRYEGTFTFFLRNVDPSEVDAIATWLKERFFGRSEGLTIDGIPLEYDVIDNSRWVALIQEAMIRRATA